MAANGNSGLGKKKLRGPLQRLLILTPTGGSKTFAPSVSPLHAPLLFSPGARCYRRCRSRQRRAALPCSRSAGSWEPNLGPERGGVVSGRCLGRQKLRKAGTGVSAHRAPLGKQSLPAGHAAGPAEKRVTPKGFDVSGWFLGESGGSCVFTLRGGLMLSS